MMVSRTWHCGGGEAQASYVVLVRVIVIMIDHRDVECDVC